MEVSGIKSDQTDRFGKYTRRSEAGSEQSERFDSCVHDKLERQDQEKRLPMQRAICHRTRKNKLQSYVTRGMHRHLFIPRIIAAGISAAWVAVAGASVETWTASEENGRIEASHGDQLSLVWQSSPLASPTGGAKFAGSAFLHPLSTPSGFEWTTIQPADHLHHFGLWWPWKHIQVDGETYNCWEIQNGQGAHLARSVKSLKTGSDKLEWDFINETVIKKPGAAPLTVIQETARVGLSMNGTDAQVLDISLSQKAADSPVTISSYRYSGFCWRGPASWNKDNSTMLTSEGRGRDDANAQPARWVFVTGPTPTGTATVLLMSAAIKVAGTPERLRVWDSKAENGAPFINFNPVMEKSLPLDQAHPAVSKRTYRVIAADRVMNTAAAEAEWKKWMGK